VSKSTYTACSDGIIATVIAQRRSRMR
jgi:hypothetical protein